MKIIQDTWDLTPLISDTSESARASIREKVEATNRAFISHWKERDDVYTEPLILREALDELERIEREYGTDGPEGFYYWLSSQANENDPNIRAQLERIEEFARKLENERSFFLIRLSQIPQDHAKRLLDAEPLAPYRHFLERTFAQGAYTLSQPEESILSLVASSSHDSWERMTSGFLSKKSASVINPQDGAGHHSVPFSVLQSYMQHTSQAVRDSAAEAFNQILLDSADMAEAEMNALMHFKKVQDELRGYPRPDSARHLADDMETQVVDSLIDTVVSHNDIAHRYYHLKAKALGKHVLAYHERNVSVGGVEKSYTFDDAVQLVDRVVGRLHPQFRSIFQQLLHNRQIDAFPRVGKRDGAFCAYNKLSQPTYLLLNFSGKLRDVTTLAHEVGHGINDELMRIQHALAFGTPLATAEVASTFMEDFVVEELMRQSDHTDRRMLLMERLNDDISTIFRQIACYRFELDLHAQFRKKGYLSKEEIGSIFQNHMTSYMGDAVEQSKGSENWWIYWGHIRRPFYVYSYASGLLISKAMQQMVREDKKSIESVKTFLSGGLSASPRDLFLQMGIDISKPDFWEKGIMRISEQLDEAESLF